MLMVNIHDAKAHLSEYLNRLQHEGEIVLCKRNQPVAVIRPLPSPRSTRAIGLEREHLNVPATFFDPLPEDLVKLYEGRGS
ncbi:MAG: type II toxin-antitoxin system prevent-host-death family antitoxin [Spirochaetaceae bacterium]|nr:MAG: type II toxin-antitoxin system prevent-host-death family antitoxin [Spirochaetaceae bacterium]